MRDFRISVDLIQLPASKIYSNPIFQILNFETWNSTISLRLFIKVKMVYNLLGWRARILYLKINYFGPQFKFQKYTLTRPLSWLTRRFRSSRWVKKRKLFPGIISTQVGAACVNVLSMLSMENFYLENFYNQI